MNTFHEWLAVRDQQMYNEIWGGHQLRSAGRWLGKKALAPALVAGTMLGAGGAVQAPIAQQLSPDDQYMQQAMQHYEKYKSHPNPLIRNSTPKEMEKFGPAYKHFGLIKPGEMDNWETDDERDTRLQKQADAEVERRMSQPEESEVDRIIRITNSPKRMKKR
jgi:hypothetical protein